MQASVLTGCNKNQFGTEVWLRLKVGDHVIYPNQGGGVIDQIVEKQVGGQPHEFFVVTLTSGGSVMIPASNLARVGLRKAASKNQIRKVLDILAGKAGPAPEQEGIEESESLDASPTALAWTVKTLHSTSKKKRLSYSQKQLLNRALTQLASEVALVTRTSLEKATQTIEKHLAEETVEAPKGSK